MFYGRSTIICIIWGGTPEYWEWLSHLNSMFYIFALPLILKVITLSDIIKEEVYLFCRFSEVAKLNRISWLDIRGKNYNSNVVEKNQLYISLT